MTSAELKYLLEQYIDNTISEEDFKRLWDTLSTDEYRDIWMSAFEDAIASGTGAHQSDPRKAMQALASIKEQIYAEKRSPIGVAWFNKKALKIAASFLIVASAAVLMLTTKTKTDDLPATTASKQVNDVKPATGKAILTLADGSVIDLENAGTGSIARQGNVQVVKSANGELQYKVLEGDRRHAADVEFNTMSTPRGGQYQLLLPDGSKVWLNAASSITYPVMFSASERKVSITGEAYFEVAKDKTKPFRVVADNVNIEVLGTHFNVNAYKDDGPVKTTLVEGSVKINDRLMKPGEAYVDGKIFQTDVEKDVAWKNGVFNFNDQNLSQIMMQLSRWYDLEVVFPDGVPSRQYGGEIGRNLNLSQVLKGLETAGVHFELQGKRLIVRP